MPTVTIDDVLKLTEAEYSRIWSDWYSNIPAEKARIEVPLSDAAAGYSHSANLMILPISEGNLDDSDILKAQAWSIWRIQLVHEMLHEWQMKKPCVPTPEANELHAKFGRRFSGTGHGPDFFQAIVEKSSYFGMTSEQLVMRI